MDKGKNKSDLLAAGRKKLQQFRQKKDNKRGGGHAKSSSKPSKLDKDDAEDQAKVPEGGGGGDQPDLDTTVPEERDSDELPRSANSLDHQEASDSGLEQCNGESSDHCNGESLGSRLPVVDDEADTAAANADQSNSGEDSENHSGLDETTTSRPDSESGRDTDEGCTASAVAVIPCSDLVSTQEVDAPSVLSEVDDVKEEGSLLPNNEIDAKKATPVNDAVESDESNEGTGVAPGPSLERAQEGNELSVPVEVSHEASTNPLNEVEVSYHDEQLDVPSSNPETSASEMEHGAHTDDVEGEGRIGYEVGAQQPFLKENVIVDFESMGELPKSLSISLEGMTGEVKEEDSLFRLESDPVDELESLRRHLYLTNITKDFLQLQLAEHIEWNAESERNSSAEVSKLQVQLKETQESKVMVFEDLVQCRSDLQAMATEKDMLENQCLSSKEEIEELSTRASELQNKLERSQQELSQVSAELADCRDSLNTLQTENLNLGARLAMEADERKKLIEENIKLSSDLVEERERSLMVLNKQTQLHDNFREMGACFEELAMENLFLSSSLVVHEATLKELHTACLQLPLQACVDKTELRITANDDSVGDSHTRCHGIDVASCTTDNSAVLSKNSDVLCSGSSAVLGFLNGHLEEANSILENLERSIEGIHAHSLSLSRSSGRGATLGISKLIQAFESNHQADNVSDVEPLVDVGKFENSYTLAKEQTHGLRDALKQMILDAQKVDVHMKEEQNMKKASENIEMKCETQRQQNEILQIKIDDLVEQLSNYKSRLDELQILLDETHKGTNDEAVALLSQIESLKQEMAGTTSTLLQERDSSNGIILEAIAKLNASTGLMILDNIDVGSLVPASVDAATAAIKCLHDNLEAVNMNYNTLNTSFQELNDLYADIKGRNELAVGLLNKLYVSLNELVGGSYQSAGEADTTLDAEELFPEKFDILIGYLQAFLDERLDLLSANKNLELELLNRNQEVEELSTRCDALTKQSEDLHHSKDGLESIVMNRSTYVEEFNRRCRALSKKLEDHYVDEGLETIPLAEGSVVADTDNDFSKSPLFRLESLVDLHIQKHGEAIGQINLSKDCLRGASNLPELPASSWSLPLPILLQQEFVPQVSELEEKLQLLSASNFQLETEVQVLKEGLSKMEEDLEVSRNEVGMKASELEQSEHRLFAVREKLSIAVAKGKGLIVQRDSLKHSLMEKSSELEKCTQELMSKEALLHEVEAKLKSSSEVDRVEALESELSYIRHSATAMRDSFLLKDSVLQRIEEVLEDLDLPENFHSKDIVEKIELLARSVAGNTAFTMTDWDQKSSVGGSQSDAGYVGTDGWKDDIQQSSNPDFDEMRRKYEELENKLYGLAEQNDMLEQSLLERNNLVQKWEEILNAIDMPPQLRSIELDHRIEWLKRAFFEVQQERDSLQLKIENLEVSSDMLIVDLEESHKKISELTAEIVAVKSEKDFFSESLDKLRYEYLGLSEKVVQDEIERDNLRREIADLHEELVKGFKNEDLSDRENEMNRLCSLIMSGLPATDMFDNVSGGSGVECLEDLLSKLLHSYTILYRENSVHKDSEKEIVLEESNSSLDKSVSKAILDAKEQELEVLMLELGEVSRNMAATKEENNEAMEKCRSLILEVEMLSNQRILLREEKMKEVEKYQSLVLELETTIKQRNDALEKFESFTSEVEILSNRQNLLEEEKTREVEKYQSLVLELDTTIKQRNDALEKCQTLVLEVENLSNQRNLLQEEKLEDLEKYQSLVLELDTTIKQRNDALEKCQTLVLEVENLSNQRNLLQEEKLKDLEKYQSLVLELDTTVKQRNSLQEQLTQEEQKTVSAREKLNVAVRKGKGLVQQRDSLKQTIEEMNTAMERLKLEHEQRLEAQESEKSLLMHRLGESEQSLWDSSQSLYRLLTALHNINVGIEVNAVDPVDKLNGIGELFNNLHSSVVSSENEAKKSKQAAGLLLAELNEIQERADILQEELEKAVAAKMEAMSHLEQYMSVHSTEKKNQNDSVIELVAGIYQLKNGCFEFSGLLSNVFTKEADIISYLEAYISSMLKQMNGANVAKLPVLESSRLLSGNQMNEEKSRNVDDDYILKMQSNFDGCSISDQISFARNSLHECMTEYENAKENTRKHSFSIDQQVASFLNTIETLQEKLASQKEDSESLQRDMAGLHTLIEEKENEVSLMSRNVSLLYEACEHSIREIEHRDTQVVKKSLAPGEPVTGKSGALLKLQSYINGQDGTDGHIFSFTDECVKTMADCLLATVKDSGNVNVIAESNQRELKVTIADLQRELQEKDIQTKRIYGELVSQIREAEAVAKRYAMDLDSARAEVLSLEKQVKMMEGDKNSLELRVNEMKDCEVSSEELQERVRSLTDALSAKDQEIEALMQALDEEELQMEGLENKTKELENIVQEKNLALENLEVSRSKAVSKLSTTVSKFNEVRNLSESLIAEIENLQSQLQGRDSEISFLRQEVTRCTDDVLASQEANKKYSSELRELLTWMDMMIARCGIPHVGTSDQEVTEIQVYTDALEKKIVSIITELDNVRMSAERKDSLLQIEKGRVEELSSKAEVLEASLRERESQVELFHERNDSGQPVSVKSPVPSEIKQIRENVSLGPIKTHVRGGRKFNNDQIAIAIDTEHDANALEDEDDDKAHGFKSLTMSRIVPRASRPLVDRIDAIWVSGERLLMRQPTLRLGLILYWIALHVLLASVI